MARLCPNMQIGVAMKFCFLLVGCLVSCSSSIAGQVAESTRGPSGWLGQDTGWATPWYEVKSTQPGPTVLITGGIHGNEPSGAYAAEQIRHWPIASGRLIVIPQVNVLGLKADSRWFPLERNDKKLRDMNRNFPTPDNETPRTRLADELWSLIQQVNPDLVIDLHEGFDFHIANSKSVGSSVICKPGLKRQASAERMLTAVNVSVTDEKRRLVLLDRSGPVMGSMARACADRLDVDAFIVETTFKDQPLSLRTRQHRTMVSTLLQERGVIAADCANIMIEPRRPGQINVGVYDATGTGENGVRNLKKIVDGNDAMRFAYLGPADFTEDIVSQFDVLVFPGGSGSRQAKAIGESGRDQIKAFVKDGGGIVGICAGAFLVSSHYDWSLHLINTSVFNKTVDIPGVGRKSMWYRGASSKVKLEFESEGASVLGKSGTVEVVYHNGPIISKGKNTELPPFRTLARFRTEVAKYDPQKGTMVDTPAIISSDFGQGRVMSISPHPEATPELRSIVGKAISWAAGP